jgi:RHS repeat-associated protein
VSPPDKNPSALGAFDFPLRFAGQYDDPETGLFYNYFRDYDPIVGRYVESDPIGLIGGLNTYLYVHGSPLRHVDRFGLDTAGCDGVPDVIEGPCTLRCCARHDECFDKWKCTGASWYKKDGCFPRQCNKCNKDARDCFTRCTYRRNHNANWETYYCAKQHRYVRIPGDFPTQSAAEAACEHDHSKDRQCCTP